MIEDTKKVVYLNSDIIEGCKEKGCEEPMGEDIGDWINHYLEHGYKLLHAGQETSHGPNNTVWYSTVAIMGK